MNPIKEIKFIQLLFALLIGFLVYGFSGPVVEFFIPCEGLGCLGLFIYQFPLGILGGVITYMLYPKMQTGRNYSSILFLIVAAIFLLVFFLLIQKMNLL